ncbi:putative membrane protein [Rhizobium azooxidifex]|uniref:Putative membrane protein n=1 Tax=Mycoplana azooxidifex TaxID=1636188 RepID=A0A7W6DAH5_9HYPH|nr:putative membrane protein [Mycoplana azooxidifex]
MARKAAADGKPMPAEWRRLYRIWSACGFPAFLAVLGIIWLMLARPAISLF